MSWIKLDDGFNEHPKIADLSDRAFRVHVAALCYCGRNLTDGRIPQAVVRTISLGRRQAVSELTAAGLWHENGTGYLINDYLDYNPSKAEVEEERERKRAIAKNAATARWSKK